jgi:hypothetical protein
LGRCRGPPLVVDPSQTKQSGSRILSSHRRACLAAGVQRTGCGRGRSPRTPLRGRTVFKLLSAIARQAAGTPWNGQDFFPLIKSPDASEKPATLMEHRPPGLSRPVDLEIQGRPSYRRSCLADDRERDAVKAMAERQRIPIRQSLPKGGRMSPTGFDLAAARSPRRSSVGALGKAEAFQDNKIGGPVFLE